MLVSNSKSLDAILKNLKISDVVAISWYDTMGMERLTHEEIEDLDEPGLTRCWGVVVKKGQRYLVIAQELGDDDSDGNYVEMLPYSLIESCRVLDHIQLNNSK